MKLFLLILVMSFPAFGCEEHLFFRVGAGKQGDWITTKGDGDWIGSSGIAADLSLGYRKPVKEWLWLDITVQHKSHWDRGWPLNDKQESELDSVTFGVEFRY